MGFVQEVMYSAGRLDGSSVTWSGKCLIRSYGRDMRSFGRELYAFAGCFRGILALGSGSDGGALWGRGQLTRGPAGNIRLGS